MDTRLAGGGGLLKSSSNRGGTEFEVQNWLGQPFESGTELVEISTTSTRNYKLCRTVPGAARTSRNLSTPSALDGGDTLRLTNQLP
jgi:hypothetical protein